MKEKIVELKIRYYTNEMNEVQKPEYTVTEDGKFVLVTEDMLLALQATLNRVG